MKKQYNILMKAAAISIILFTLSSCKKYLDTPMPTNSISATSGFTSKGTIDKMMNRLYINFSDNLVNAPVFPRNSEVLSDNAYNPTRITDYVTQNITPTSGGFINWTSVYRIIYTANLMIEGLPTATAKDITAATTQQYIAAAKTMRAYAYFHLVRHFGDVPIITSTKVVENSFTARNPKEDVYTQIEKDLQDAMTNLPAALGAKYFINNKFIPEAILADVYLTEGKWAQAETAATDIIGSNLFRLDNVTDVFLQTSPETISALGYTSIWNVTDTPKTAASGSLEWPGFSASYESFLPALSEDLLNSFETGDLRKTNWTQLSNAGNYVNPNNRIFSFKYKYNTDIGTPVIAAGKEEDFKFIRLAEVILIRSEAMARQGKLTNAATDLNLIRTRAGLANTTATTQADLLTAIIKERRVELFFEKATRWYDLVRTNTAGAVLSAIPYKAANWKSYMVLYPLPTDVLSANPKLTQTPGY